MNIRILIIVVFWGACLSVLGQVDDTISDRRMRFLMVYETNHALKLKQSVLYFASGRKFKNQIDSTVVVNSGSGMPDSICFDTVFVKPHYLKLKLCFAEGAYESQAFHYTSLLPIWDVFVSDSTIRVKNKVIGDSFDNQSSMRGFILIIQTILEMLLAWLFSRIFGWTRLSVLLVLVGNLAAFPVYLLGLSNVFIRDGLIFVVKAGVMSLVGMRKLSVWKIVLLASILTIISFGSKELLFTMIRLF